MFLFFSKIWTFLKRTVFNLTWWKKHWYLPWAFLLGIVVWIFTGGKGSALSFIKRTNKIRTDEREAIDDIERRSTEEETKLDESSRLKKEKIKAKTEEKIANEKARIKKQQEIIRGDSEAINKDINDAFNL